MNWIFHNIEAMRQLPTSLLLSHMTAKYLMGFGAGILAAHVFDLHALFWGILFIAVSIVMSIPSGRLILKNRREN